MGTCAFLKNKAVKEWLSRYAIANQRVDVLEQRLSMLELSAPDGIGAQRVRQQLDEEKKSMEPLYSEIESAIMQGVSTELGKEILQLRYLDKMDWKDIAAVVYGGKADFLKKKGILL